LTEKNAIRLGYSTVDYAFSCTSRLLKMSMWTAFTFQSCEVSDHLEQRFFF